MNKMNEAKTFNNTGPEGCKHIILSKEKVHLLGYLGLYY